jgi:hypothetical protein
VCRPLSWPMYSVLGWKRCSNGSTRPQPSGIGWRWSNRNWQLPLPVLHERLQRAEARLLGQRTNTTATGTGRSRKEGKGKEHVPTTFQS